MTVAAAALKLVNLILAPVPPPVTERASGLVHSLTHPFNMLNAQPDRLSYSCRQAGQCGRGLCGRRWPINSLCADGGEGEREREGGGRPLVLLSPPPSSDICSRSPGRMHDSSGEPQLSRSPSFISNSFEAKQARPWWIGSLPLWPRHSLGQRGFLGLETGLPC